MAKRDPVSGPQALALALANHPESCIGTAAPGPPVATEAHAWPRLDIACFKPAHPRAAHGDSSAAHAWPGIQERTAE